MFLIMFKTGHALPLVGTRFLRPRSSRGESAAQPRDVSGSWPRTRQNRDLDSVGNRTWTQTVRVREHSVSAFSPRPPSRLQTIRVLDNAPTSTTREQASDTNRNSPQAVRRLGLSASANSPRSRIVRELRLAKQCPPRRIVVSILPPIHFPVRVQIIPTYGRI